MTAKRCLVFGGFGTIGAAVVRKFEDAGYKVWKSSRSKRLGESNCLEVIGNGDADEISIKSLPALDSVVWAQGANLNDSINDFSTEKLDEVFDANVKYVASTISTLLSNNKLGEGSKLCIVSSIWQEAIRPKKLSYSISKSALSGLLKSVSVDLAERGIFVNAVLPGVIDTPMTRDVLSGEQIVNIQQRTGFGRLVRPEELAEVIYFLCSELNTCVSGQSITVDLGFANVRPL